VKHNERVCESGVYNLKGCRIPVNDRFDTELIRRLLGPDYDDLLVRDFLKYGFPIGIKGGDYKNHCGANEFPNEIEKYLGKESKDCRILGPFKTDYFSSNLKVSQLNSVPKKETSERSVMFDLCMPKGYMILVAFCWKKAYFLWHSVKYGSEISSTNMSKSVLLNAKTMPMDVTPELFTEIGYLVKLWLAKKEASLRELKSLIGKFNFVVRPVR
ncbi:hypothetical protein MAR_013545, partial [Mya arenaria]